jgi:uncharacterized RDD family membrane protein YckC
MNQIEINELTTETNQKSINQNNQLPNFQDSDFEYNTLLRMLTKHFDIIFNLFCLITITSIISIVETIFKQPSQTYLKYFLLNLSIIILNPILMTYKGGTAGQLFFGLNVVTKNNKRLPLWRSFLRYFGNLLSFFPFIDLTNLIKIVNSNQKISLYDNIFSTRTKKVKQRKLLWLTYPVAIILLIALIIIMALTTGHLSQKYNPAPPIPPFTAITNLQLDYEIVDQDEFFREKTEYVVVKNRNNLELVANDLMKSRKATVYVFFDQKNDKLIQIIESNKNLDSIKTVELKNFVEDHYVGRLEINDADRFFSKKNPLLYDNSGNRYELIYPKKKTIPFR